MRLDARSCAAASAGVELQVRARRSRPSRSGSRAARARRRAERAPRGRVGEQARERVAQRRRRRRARRARRAPWSATSGKPPTALSTSGRPNASAVKRTPDWSISRYGQHDEVGAAKNAGSSASADEARDEAHAGRRTPRFSAAVSIRGMPTTHSSAPSMPRHASSSDVDALVRAQQAEAAGRPGPSTPASSGGSGRASGTSSRW